MVSRGMRQQGEVTYRNGVVPTPAIDRVLRRTRYVAGCWEFQGTKYLGYGVVGLGSRADGTVLVHRLVFQELVGPLTPGLVLDHLCRNHACCNPLHLEEVTLAENTRRGARVARGAGTNGPRHREPRT